MSDPNQVGVDGKIYIFGGVMPLRLEEPIPVLDHGYVKYIEHMGTDLTPLEAARMSTGNETGVDTQKDDKLREYLWSNHHATPFEMCELHIEVQAPIFVFRQWHRHRTMSYNEFSGRYSQMPDLFYVPEPERVKGKGKQNKQGSEESLPPVVVTDFVRDAVFGQLTARNNYLAWQEDGIANELARINLPLSQYSKMRAKANLRNWFHFLTLRLDPHAQEEIRVYAQAIQQIIQVLWPKTWEVFEEHTLYAKTFSRTEMTVLLEILTNVGVTELTGVARRKGMTGPRIESLFQKLGWTGGHD